MFKSLIDAETAKPRSDLNHPVSDEPSDPTHVP